MGYLDAGTGTRFVHQRYRAAKGAGKLRREAEPAPSGTAEQKPVNVDHPFRHQDPSSRGECRTADGKSS